jgi:hypothetical protein
MLSTIRAALKTNLETVTTLQDVQLGRTLDFTGFPACRFYLVNLPQELKDNSPSYWRSYSFVIQIIQELKDPTEAEERIQDTVEAVIDGLSTGWTLGNSVDVSAVTGSPVTEVEFPFGPCLLCEISFDARVLVS